MRYMIMVRATATTEAGLFPADADQLLAEMGAYHQELARAGVLLDGSGLQPSSRGFRVQWDGGRQHVVDGPFTESKELIAGYTLIQVGSHEEALEWARRYPNPMGRGRDAAIEVRPLYEAEDVQRLVAEAGRTLATRRRLPATRAQVLACFSEPARLARWWGPAGFRNTFQTFEFRPGGRWVFVMHGPDGKDWPNESTFVEAGPERVVVRHDSAPGFTLTMALHEANGATELQWRQVFDTVQLREQLEPICIPANEQNLDRLTAELAR